MNKAYDKVTWQNTPSTASPINATNLNKMSDALDTIDDRVIALDGQATALQEGKVDKVSGKGLSTEDFTTTEKSKLAGISANAKNVSITPVVTEGTTLANITIDGTTTAIKGSDIDVDDEMSPISTNPVQNKVIYDALNNLLPEETAEGNPISITDASGLSAKSCEVAMLPIQDLHGQSAPYPAGGGKNKCDYDTFYSSYKVAENSFEMTNSQFATMKYSLANFIGQEMTFSMKITGCQGFNRIYLRATINEGNTDSTAVTPSTTFPATIKVTFTPQTENDTVYLTFGSATGGINVKVKDIQLESGNQVTTFAPYSNICPISGWTELNVWQSGKNMSSVNLVQNVGWAENNTDLADIFNSLPVGDYVLSFGVKVNSVTQSVNSWLYGMIGVANGVEYRYGKTISSTPTVNYTDSTSFTLSITTENVGKFTKLYLYGCGNNNMGKAGESDITNIQISTSVGAFEPYQGETHTATFPDTVYGGKVVWNRDGSCKAIIDRIVETINSMEYYGLYGDYNAPLFYYDLNSSVLQYQNSSNPVENKLLSNIYNAISTSTTGQMKNFEFRTRAALSTTRLYFRDDRFTNATEMNEWIANNPVQACGKLTTPQEITLTAEQIELLKGQNVLRTDGDNIALKYSADIKEWVLAQLQTGNRNLTKSSPITEPQTKETEITEETEDK